MPRQLWRLISSLCALPYVCPASFVSCLLCALPPLCPAFIVPCLLCVLPPVLCALPPSVLSSICLSYICSCPAAFLVLPLLKSALSRFALSRYPYMDIFNIDDDNSLLRFQIIRYFKFCFIMHNKSLLICCQRSI